MKPCPICGETRRLGPDGVCAWRFGCEHRAMVTEARARQLDGELARILEPAPSWQEEAWRVWSELPEHRWEPPIRPLYDFPED